MDARVSALRAARCVARVLLSTFLMSSASRPIVTLLPQPEKISVPPSPTPEPNEPPVTHAMQLNRVLALRIALGVSILAVCWVLAPYFGWLVLAAWFAALARPLLNRLSARAGGRHRAAAIITLGMLLVIIAPISFVVASLTVDAIDLVSAVTSADSGTEALEGLVSHHGGAPQETHVVAHPTAAIVDATAAVDPTAVVAAPVVGMDSVVGVVRANSDRAFEMVVGAAGSLVQVLLGFMVLFSGAYMLLVHGPALFKWFEGLAPASNRSMERLRDAFVETGRGLLVGSGLTGLTQACIGTIIYFALGVPRAFVLGFLTLISSVIPGVGTALVWVPVSAGLYLTGHTTQAIIMAVLGTLFISAIDNVVRPFFVRWGKLELSPFIVMVSVFGGLAAAGPWGLLIGPIVLRVGLEVLRISRDEHVI